MTWWLYILKNDNTIILAFEVNIYYMSSQGEVNCSLSFDSFPYSYQAGLVIFYYVIDDVAGNVWDT